MFLKSRQIAIEGVAHLLMYGTIIVTMEIDVRNILAIRTYGSAKEKYNIRGDFLGREMQRALPAAYMTKECFLFF